MTLVNRGLLTLGGVTLPADPKIYEPKWPKRGSVSPGLGGSVTIQEFPITIKDKSLRLESGDTQFLDTLTLNSLLALYFAPATTYTLTDWLDNIFVVYIANFEWKFFTFDLWTYNMDLLIRSATRLYGQPYTGS